MNSTLQTRESSNNCQPHRKRHWLPACGMSSAMVAWLWLTTNTTCADDWMTWRSTYTHDVAGQRVDQYAPAVEPPAPDQGNLVRSGFRYYRSTIQGSTTADNLNVTYEWGRPVMPYEHWRFPFRPYGSPYSQWGPPVPNVLNNFNTQSNFGTGALPGGVPGSMPAGIGGQLPGAGVNGYPGTGYPNAGYPNAGYPGTGHPNAGYPYPTSPNPSAPWVDGLYPSAPPMGR